MIGQWFSYQAAADAARAAIPALKDRIPEGNPGFVDDTYTLDGSKAARVLGLEYRPLAVTVVDTFRDLLNAEQIEASA